MNNRKISPRVKTIPTCIREQNVFYIPASLVPCNRLFSADSYIINKKVACWITYCHPCSSLQRQLQQKTATGSWKSWHIMVYPSAQLKALSLLGKLQRGSTLVVNHFWQNVLRLRSRLNAIKVSKRSVAIVLRLWSTVWSTIATEAVFQGVIAKCAVSSNYHLWLWSKENWKQTYWSATLLRNCYNMNSSSYHRDINCQRYWNCHKVWSIDQQCYLEAVR